ncbi:Response regulator PleD [Bremerella volcania]|uniref:diguanylate cyclase n=1 Tax=Bremerella volcania TaxID=2527984 RepID=A0A518CBU0_9BACT|nr:diguanylate cyclase [Bremerella volcania]QDU76654.1 Response regulator PleD [Bremerella volcania]
MTFSKTSQPELPPTRSRVLVVDDDRLIRTLIREFLTREGYEIVTVENCRQALEVLEEEKNEFKFLVTDWELPDGSGIDLIRHVRHVVSSHYMYIVMATSHGNRENLTQALNAGADDFLAKPIDRGELVARMRSGQRILALETRLTHLANSDPLTSLPTRRVFEEMVSKEWSRSRRHRLPLSFVIFDIDYFKRINDVHGHVSGDQVLREIGRILSDSVRKSDIICRYGGEEFCAVLPETSSAQACIWAENLRKRIAETEIILDSAVVNVTTSFGIVEAMAEMEELDDLIEIADQCLIEAKQKGRNQVVSFNNLQNAVCCGDTGHLDLVFGGAVAADAMTPVVSTVTPDSSVIDISQFFLNYRIPSAPVVDHEGSLVGIVSEKDLMSVACRPNPHEITIAEVMRKNLICYPPNIPLRIVWEFLNRVSIRTVLITENSKTLGVLSRQSILRWLANTTWNQNGPMGHAGDVSNTSSQRLEVAAKLLAETSRQLTNDVEVRTEDEHAAMVIGTVSKMQDLMTDLLEAVRGGSGSGAMSLGTAFNTTDF